MAGCGNYVLSSSNSSTGVNSDFFGNHPFQFITTPPPHTHTSRFATFYEKAILHRGNNKKLAWNTISSNNLLLHDLILKMNAERHQFQFIMTPQICDFNLKRRPPILLDSSLLLPSRQLHV